MPEPFVDAEDIAGVAVAALTEAGHTGRLYEVTGPRLLTFAEAVEEIAKPAGREIRFVPVTRQQFASGLAAHEVPDGVVPSFARDAAATGVWKAGELLETEQEAGSNALRGAITSSSRCRP